VTTEQDAVAVALSLLREDDPELAELADAGFQSLTWGQGPQSIAQHDLQEFLWYHLPLNWATDVGEHKAVAAALGRLLELLGLPRYAAICAAPTTGAVLDVYDRGEQAGLAAYRRAVDASGVEPPDLPELAWSAVMGSGEASAYWSTANALELAIVAGELRPGSRGWRQVQRQLVHAYLSSPRAAFADQTFFSVVLTERLQRWVDDRGEARRQLLAPVANMLIAAVPVPEGAAEALAPLRWLLERAADGIPLTQSGNLSRAVVLDGVERFGWWPWRGRPRGQNDVPELHDLRELGQRRLKALRRRGRSVALTAAGRALLADPGQLWRGVAAALTGGGDFDAAVAELALAVLVRRDVTYPELADLLVPALAAGWRAQDTGGPPNAGSVRCALGPLLSTLELLALLRPQPLTLHEDPRSLTDVGRATALAALRARATAPRRQTF
jgi:hypothetical protein